MLKFQQFDPRAFLESAICEATAAKVAKAGKPEPGSEGTLATLAALADGNPETQTSTPERDARDDDWEERAAIVQYEAGAPRASWDAADWCCFFDERAAIAEHDGRRPRRDSERMAWAATQNEWHRRHGEHAPSWQCAGCREPISGQPVFAFPDGARAHDDLTCIASYGRRWRSAATAALTKMGLRRPRTLPEDETGAWCGWGEA